MAHNQTTKKRYRPVKFIKPDLPGEQKTEGKGYWPQVGIALEADNGTLTLIFDVPIRIDVGTRLSIPTPHSEN